MPLRHVNSMIKAVSEGIGVTVTNSIDTHSVLRIVTKSRIASELQLVTEIHSAGSEFNLYYGITKFADLIL